MESINNAASAASRAVFGGSSGQSGQEPVSGQTGRGTAGEPYDAGNTMGKVSPVNYTACFGLSSVITLNDCAVSAGEGELLHHATAMSLST